MFKIIGFDDSVHTCDCCGKNNLKSTVIVEVDGEVMRYGSVCATRHTKLTGKEIKQAVKSAEDGRYLAADKEYHNCPEYMSLEARTGQAYRAGIKPGVEFFAFIKKERDAANEARNRIAEKFNVRFF